MRNYAPKVLRAAGFVLGLIGLLALAETARGTTISGSLSLNGLNTADNGSNLLTSTIITTTNTRTAGTGVGNYSLVPLATDFGPNTLNLTSLSSFTLSNATYGTFAASSGSILTQTPNFLNVSLLGTFTPGPGLPGLTATSSALDISVVEVGTSMAEAIALNSPAVPEPSALLLSTVGGLAIIMAGWRSRGSC
jgi:hypothetical protein